MMAEGRDRQLWAHTSCLLALLWNVNRDPKKGSPKVPADFNPWAKQDEQTGGRIKGDIQMLKVFVEKE